MRTFFIILGILLGIGILVFVYFYFIKDYGTDTVMPPPTPTGNAKCDELKAKYYSLFNQDEMKCYRGTHYSAEHAISWFNPTQAPCSRAGIGCNGSKKRACENTIDEINRVITEMRNTCK